MRDNHFYPEELLIVGLDFDPRDVGGIGYDADSNALPDSHEAIQGLKNVMMSDTGVFGSVTYTRAGGKTIVLVGRKRVRALRLVNVERVKAGLDRLKIEGDYRALPSDEGQRALVAEQLRVAENRQRYTDRDPMTAVNEAMSLLNRGATAESAAVVMRMTANGIRRYQKISELAPVVKAAISRDEIGLDAALLLHGLPEPKQAEKLNALLAKTEPTVPLQVKLPASAAPGKPAPAKRRNAKKAKDAPSEPKPAKTRTKRISKEAVATELGAAVKRSAKTVRRLVALPNLVFNGVPPKRLVDHPWVTPAEAFDAGVKAGALWAIGALTDQEVGLVIKGNVADEKKEQ